MGENENLVNGGQAEPSEGAAASSVSAPSTWTPKKGVVTRVRIPLPSQLAGAIGQGSAAGTDIGSSAALAGSGVGAKRSADDPFCRAENEDDDGYDPYSDRKETVPVFERDPWS